MNDLYDELMYRRDSRPRKFMAVQDRNTPLKLDPHYRHDADMFKNEQVVLGVDTGDLSWSYSDRLWEFDWNKAKAASAIANEGGYVGMSANHIEAYLTAYFGRKIDLVCVVSGINRSNGYSYNVYGYRREEESQ